MNAQSIMPVLFIGHGSPTNAIAHNDYTRAVAKIGEHMKMPQAILMISAHWMTKATMVTAMERPKTIHDFYGFPQELFDVEYAAAGSPDLARTLIKEISSPSILADVKDWGLDHGTWSVLRHLYPQANVPVVQMSLDMTKPPLYHYELGKKLKFLRQQGVLIIASGNIVHNLRQIDWSENARAHDWAIEFDEWVKTKALAGDFESLVNDFQKTKSGLLSNPGTDHYLPLLYILGAVDEMDQLSFPYEGIQNASISMRSFMWGPKALA